MSPELERLKGEYDVKQAAQSKNGQYAKLSEEAAELAAAINKYLQIDMGLYDCKSSKEKAWRHIIEEAGDVFMMMQVCKLTPKTADIETRGNLIHRMIYKAFRFVGREKDYTQFIANVGSPVVQQKQTGVAQIKRPHRRLRKNPTTVEIIISNPYASRQGVYTGSENPWREGMEGDFE